MKTRTLLLATAGIAVTTAGAAGAVTAMRASAVAEQVSALGQQLRDGEVRVSGLQHEKGLLKSKGRFEVAVQPGCDAAEADATPVKAVIEYELSHFGLPTAPVRFTLSARPGGELGAQLKESLGDRALVSAQGTAGRDGAVEATLAMPELAMRDGTGSLKIAASSGRFAMAASTLAFDWSTDRATVRDGEGAYEVRGVRLGVNLADTKLGTGTSKLEIQHVDTPVVQMEGLALSSDAALRGEFLDAGFSSTVKKVTVSDDSLTDLALDLSAKGLHAKSWETLVRIGTESCGFQGMTRAETAEARDAARKLLVRGLSVAVSRLAAAGPEGAFKGELELGLEPSGERATSLPPTLAKQAFARGRVEMTGRLLDEAQREQLLSGGFAIERGKALVASFDFTRGALSLNGAPDRTGIADSLQAALTGVDTMLAETLAGSVGDSRSPKAAAAAPAAPARAPVKVGLPF
ncbi:MAG: DUF945 family protein [Burkholderiales bacterium]